MTKLEKGEFFIDLNKIKKLAEDFYYVSDEKRAEIIEEVLFITGHWDQITRAILCNAFEEEVRYHICDFWKECCIGKDETKFKHDYDKFPDLQYPIYDGPRANAERFCLKYFPTSMLSKSLDELKINYGNIKNRKDFSLNKKTAGIYFGFNITKNGSLRLTYIGQSEDIEKRIKTHEKGFTHFSHIEVPNEKRRVELEKNYIKKYNPIQNRSLKIMKSRWEKEI